MNTLYNTILSYPKLADRIRGKKEDTSRAKKLIDEIHADYQKSFVRKMKSMLDVSFAKLYDGTELDIEKGLDLRQVCEDYHVVFVPNHQSHADYLALNYVLFDEYELPIHIAGGINLNVFPIGKMFRKSGCFFIRRSFQSDILYKLVLEGYLYYVIHNNFPIEFFFEGGRSRTGKLLPPKYGLFHMLLEAHSYVKDEKPLAFLPVSIMHEILPEESAHVKELEGKKKVKESSTQLLKLYKVFSKKFGTVHLRIGKPLFIQKKEDMRSTVQNLAFRCFRQVGKGMTVTPSSLLSLVLLDDSVGALTLEQIFARSKSILDYCIAFDIPVSKSLQGDKFNSSILGGIELFVEGKKMQLIEKKKLGQNYYVVNKASRREMLYFKNTILHHFLVPHLINSALLNVMNGKIYTVEQLKDFLIEKRNELKYEFYLPTVKELFQKALRIIMHATEHKVSTLEECMQLTTTDFYKIYKLVGIFSRAFNYLHEVYFVVAQTLLHFSEKSFTGDQFMKAAEEIFEMEIEHGRIIKYAESFNIPLIRNSLHFFTNIDVIELDKGKYTIKDLDHIHDLMEKYAKEITELLSNNFKLE